MMNLGLVADYREEEWPSMDLFAEMFTHHCPPSVRLHPLRPTYLAFGQNTKSTPVRAFNRYLAYSASLLLSAPRLDGYYVVDQSYSHLVSTLPRRPIGVTCHDLDAFACLLTPTLVPRSHAFRTMTRLILRGLQQATRIFCVSMATHDLLLHHRLVPRSRLQLVPPGIAPEFCATLDPHHDSAVRAAVGENYLLHVGSTIPRKRIDLLLSYFAAFSKVEPGIRLVKLGGELTPAQRDQLHSLALGERFVHVPSVSRAELAAYYRNARAVIQCSDAEGFGLPIIEALACGTPVVASDLAVLREVGGDAVSYAPIGNVSAWVDHLKAICRTPESVVSRSQRLAQAAKYSWPNHVREIVDAFQRLV